MHSLDFYNAIKQACSQQPQSLLNKTIPHFLRELTYQLTLVEIDESLIMSRLTILFEGFYKYLNNDTELKQNLCDVRNKRWSQHFGTPTLTFLLTYQTQINETKNLFELSASEEALPEERLHFPWMIHYQDTSIIDNKNSVIIDRNSLSNIEVPTNKEVTGVFTKTHNPFGGFTTTACDPVSQKFIEHASRVASSQGKVLEIGAGFGSATLDAISKGATVFCNDISPENLAVIQKRYTPTYEISSDNPTGDQNKLILLPGELPDELKGLPEKFFDAILICRVLHFFTGKKIEEALALMSKLLAPGGKIYIVCETPYLKNWQKFIPEFNARVSNEIEWPGEITEPALYESSGRASSLPKFVHWITKEVLERSLQKVGLLMEHSEYINRKGQFPEDLLLPEEGRESIGAIGIK